MKAQKGGHKWDTQIWSQPSDSNVNFALTLGYLNPALNKPEQEQVSCLQKRYSKDWTHNF